MASRRNSFSFPAVPWVQRGLAIGTAAGVGLLALLGWWPFNTSPAAVSTFAHPTIWQYLLSDRYVLGVLRLGAVALALYLVISIPPLVAAARWAKGFGTSGVTADDAAKASKALEDYEETVADLAKQLDTANATIERVSSQRDAAIRLVTQVTRTSTSTAPGAATMRKEDNAEDDADGDQPEAGGAD
jgi:hypothetical protein